jgi:Nif-specific regulatory protein
MIHLPLAAHLPLEPRPQDLRAFPCVQEQRGDMAALHLPVAPLCGIQCVYCDRSGDCVHQSPRGSASLLLTSKQAISYALESIRSEPRIKCIGVSGPGDPLANPDATFSTLRQLRMALPGLPFFIATNGLKLVDSVDQFVELGVTLCIVTVNSVHSQTLARMIDWVQGPSGMLAGDEAAQFLLAQQLSGIRATSAAGIAVRVNFQLMPSINDNEIEDVARTVSEAGAGFFHVQRFEPPDTRRSDFADVAAPNLQQMNLARELAGRHIELIKHCSLCAADSVGCLAQGQVGPVRALLQSSVLNKDDAVQLADSGIPDPAPEFNERRVALRQLQLIAKVARWLSTSEDDTVGTILQVLVWLDESLGLKRGVVALVDAAGETLQAQITYGVEQEQADLMRYRIDEGVTGQVFSTGRAQMLPSLQASASFLDRSGLRAGLDLSKVAFFCVPIRDRGSVIGTLSADKENSLLKDADSDLELLGEIAQLFAPFVQRRRLEESLSLFRRLRSSEGPFSRLVGRSSAMEDVRRLIAKVAPAATSVLFTGETGTGKSAAAILVHELSPRASGPFIEVNCGAIPENLLESELFGHERGAFTGAIQRRLGVFERARGGTVFLDEVAELGPSAQTRLLRVLQTHRFERVGGSETLTTDVRIIAATNKDLATAVSDGSFRADLYYRLCVFPIVMPPLRERGKADLMLLADSFVDRHGRSMGKSIFRIDTPAIDMITAYHWPGNVRELENVLERAVVLAEGEVIHGHHLPPSLQMNRYAGQPENLDFGTRVADFEIELITEALKDAGGNQTKAAERLGLTKRIIQYKIRNYNIPWERFVPKG